jgi:hypothetical protein
MTEAVIPSPKQVNEYMRRLETVQREVQERGWGTKMQIAFATQIPPSRVSGVLLVREVNEEYLAKIEQWLKDNPSRRPIEVK